MTDTPRSGAELLASGGFKRREGDATILLVNDLFDEHDRLDDELAESIANDAKSNRLGAGGQSKRTLDLKEQIEALEEKMEAAQLRFHFRALTKDRFYRICDDHPPRENNAPDFMAGYDREAVNGACVREMLVDPVFEDCTDKTCDHSGCGTWQQLLTIINPSEWGELVRVCQELNGVTTSAPKSALAASVRARPARGSKQQRASE